MGKNKHPFLFAFIYGGALTLYAAFTLLDAFVIPRDVVKVDFFADSSEDNDDSNVLSADSTDAEPSDVTSVPQTTASSSEVSAASTASQPEESLPPEPELPAEPVITENSYLDREIEININTVFEYGSYIYVADIRVKEPKLLKTGLAYDSFGRNVTQYTSGIAESCGAVLAINGDFYGFRDSGYVMRNGYLYRDKAKSDQQDLVVYKDGSFEMINEAEISASELAQKGAFQIFSFGPGLIVNGNINVDSHSEVEMSMMSNPRTAIGIIEPLHYVFIVSDGRTYESAGLSLLELAEFMKGLGCTDAYNLDGGGSSAMWFMGRIVNKPTSGYGEIKERGVSDIVYIGH